MVMHGSGPRAANRVGWLARLLTGLRKAEELIPGRLPIQIVQNPALQRQRLLIAEVEAMLDTNLRRPTPQISRIGKGRSGERCKRCWRKRREEQGVLTGNHRGMLPVEPQARGLHAHKTKVDAVIRGGEASRKIEHYVR